MRWMIMSILVSTLLATPTPSHTAEPTRGCRARTAYLEMKSELFGYMATSIERKAQECGNPALALELGAAALVAGEIRYYAAARRDRDVFSATDVTHVRHDIDRIQTLFHAMDVPAGPCHDEMLFSVRVLYGSPLDELARAVSSQPARARPFTCPGLRPFCDVFGFQDAPVGPESDAPFCGEP